MTAAISLDNCFRQTRRTNSANSGHGSVSNTGTKASHLLRPSAAATSGGSGAWTMASSTESGTAAAFRFFRTSSEVSKLHLELRILAATTSAGSPIFNISRTSALVRAAVVELSCFGALAWQKAALAEQRSRRTRKQGRQDRHFIAFSRKSA